MFLRCFPLVGAALLASLIAACSNTAGEGNVLSKEEARTLQSKADDGTDYCALFDWYGDGICDDFCADPDPDCGVACGGLLGLACEPDEFCDFEPGAYCGAADQTGTCKPIPMGCTKELHEVCGCDDVTYQNPCMANAAGVSVASDGPCGGGTPDGTLGASCGGDRIGGPATCNEGLYCAYEVWDYCGFADAAGTCQPIPEVCLAVVDPVCGCDGETYGNECEANAAGLSIQHEGPCPPEQDGD